MYMILFLLPFYTTYLTFFVNKYIYGNIQIDSRYKEKVQDIYLLNIYIPN